MTALIEEHHAVVYRYAFRMSGHQADAEDLTQQTFANAHEYLDQLREPAKARGWLLAIARRCFCKLARRKRPVSAEAVQFDLDQVAQPEPNEIWDREALQRALQQLPEEFRVVVLMFFFEHLSYRQIAAELEIAEGTVMSRLSRAKSHLRKMLGSLGESSTIGNASDKTARRK